MIKKTLQISFLSFAGSLLGFLCQLFIAKYFGATSSFDLFVVASTYPLFLTGLIAITLNHYLIPELAKRKNIKIRSKFYFLIFLSFIAFFIITAVFGYFIAPFQLLYFGSSENAEYINVARIYWVCAALNPILGLFQSVHIVKNNILYVTKAHLIPILMSLSFLLVFKNSDGIIILAYSLLAGTILNIFFLARSCIFDMTPYQIKLKDYVVLKSFFKKMNLIVLSILCYIVFQSSDVYWCKFLPTSSLSYVSYMQRFLVAFTALNMSTPIQLFLPYLSNQINSGKKNVALMSIIKIFRVSVTLIIFQSIFFYIYSEEIISALLQRGLFDEVATQNVAKLISISIFSSIFYVGSTLLLRFLLAEYKYKISAASGVFIAVTYFVMSGLFTMHFGLIGIPIAYSISWSLYFIKLLIHVFRGQWNLIFNTHNFVFLKNILFNSSLFVLIGFIIKKIYGEIIGTSGFGIIYLMIVFLFMGAIYLLLIIKIFPLEDLKYLYKKYFHG